ncbi:MAG: hypothetical protein ACOYPR_04920 [Saprospiraceae bacterium]
MSRLKLPILDIHPTVSGLHDYPVNRFAVGKGGYGVQCVGSVLYIAKKWRHQPDKLL